MILPRILTAVVGIPLIILALWWGGIPYFILVSGITLFSLNEFFLIARKAGYAPRVIPGIAGGYLVFAAVFASSTAFSQKADHQLVAITLTVALMALNAIELFRGDVSGAVGRIGVTFYGIFLMPWALAHLGKMRDINPYGREWVLLLFAVIWILDTAAYFFGVKFGRNRLASAISPKKSVEGLIAALAAGAVSAVVVGKMLMGVYVTVMGMAVLGFFIAAFAQFSDLSESLIKRDADIKDSDTLLPGHGGMLDRFDSFIFTAPLVYYYLIMFK